MSLRLRIRSHHLFECIIHKYHCYIAIGIYYSVNYRMESFLNKLDKCFRLLFVLCVIQNWWVSLTSCVRSKLLIIYVKGKNMLNRLDLFDLQLTRHSGFKIRNLNQPFNKTGMSTRCGITSTRVQTILRVSNWQCENNLWVKTMESLKVPCWTHNFTESFLESRRRLEKFVQF